MFIVSHKYKYVFIHVYKNAGRSIIQALSPSFLPGPVSRLNSFLSFNPELQAYTARRLYTHLISEYKGYPVHSSALLISEIIGSELFRTYTSFACIRNPWDWQVSLYNYILKTKKHSLHEKFKSLGSFSEYIRWHCDGHQRSQLDFVTDKNNNVMVNKLIRFENLGNDLNALSFSLGLPNSSVIGSVRINPSRQINVSYRSHYNDETSDIVKKAYQDDIVAFGYKF